MITVVMLVLFSIVSRAEIIKVKAATVKEINITGLKGGVILVAKEGAEFIQVKYKKKSDTATASEVGFNEWSLQKNIKDGVFSLNVVNNLSKLEWKDQLHKNVWPSYQITITGPSKKLQLFWREGVVSITGWTSPVEFQTVSAKVKAHNNNSDIKISNQDGKIWVSNHKGGVEIETYSADVNLQSIVGPVKVYNFSGQNIIKNTDGAIHLELQSGRVKIEDSIGKIDFKNKRATIHLKKFKGRIRGKSGSGDILAELIGEADFRVRAKEGKVRVRALSSGAFVSVGSNEGDLLMPKYMKMTRHTSVKVINGHLRGPQKGRIYVRTQSGSISVR